METSRRFRRRWVLEGPRTFRRETRRAPCRRADWTKRLASRNSNTPTQAAWLHVILMCRVLLSLTHLGLGLERTLVMSHNDFLHRTLLPRGQRGLPDVDRCSHGFSAFERSLVRAPQRAVKSLGSARPSAGGGLSLRRRRTPQRVSWSPDASVAAAHPSAGRIAARWHSQNSGAPLSGSHGCLLSAH